MTRIKKAEEAACRELRALLRDAVEKTIREVCALKKWSVRALAVRSNHVHVLVQAGDISAGEVMRILKAYATRMLNQVKGRRNRWWTRGGSKRRIKTEESLHAAIGYVQNQDTSWMDEYGTPKREPHV